MAAIEVDHGRCGVTSKNGWLGDSLLVPLSAPQPQPTSRALSLRSEGLKFEAALGMMMSRRQDWTAPMVRFYHDGLLVKMADGGSLRPRRVCSFFLVRQS